MIGVSQVSSKCERNLIESKTCQLTIPSTPVYIIFHKYLHIFNSRSVNVSHLLIAY